VAIEVPFGFGEPDANERLSQADPVLLSIGGGESIRLRGRIDRIDRLDDGTYEVIDYKTGRLRRDEYKGTFAGGKLLQHTLYAETARQLLCGGSAAAPVISRSTYWFCTEKAWGEWVSKPGGLDAKAVLRDLTEAVAGGAFIRGAKEAGCRYCDYRHACTDVEVAMSGEKRNDPNLGVAALRRLAEHE
jgi:hypothetical protein